MFQFKRRDTLWLAALGAMLALVIISSSISPGAQALLIGGFLAAFAASILNLGEGRQVFQTLQQRTTRSRMSAQAREAADRARGRVEYDDSDLQLIDIGVIATQSGREGMVMRRTRSISKDDDGVRPFVTLFVPPEEADRRVNLRFEFIDQSGKEQYVHEMGVFLRDGEMNILTEDHLPLLQNSKIAGMGDWDLRVYVDGTLIGVHTFALTASYEDRRRRLHGGQHFITGENGERVSRNPDDEDEAVPLRLEELLREQNQKQQRG